LPDTSGYEVGTAHQAGAGVMSGDLLDVFRLPSGWLCCVVGDVSGHDVEASISALQTKFLLRTYLRRYRDPGQALEELNRQLIDHERPEEFVSLFVVVFDDEAETLRYSSAGHPAGWLCSERAPRALRATGPLLMMDAASRYRSIELPYAPGDLVVLSTDGLLEARQGDQFFGEDRVAGLVRRDWDMSTQVLCKTLIDEAVDFSAGPLGDDVTVLAVRKR
jgi:sigma-B regulation protein RsbU (phosphoserine phosphatase)